MTWYRRDPQRFALEVDLLRRATDGKFARIDETLIFDEDVEVGAVRFGVHIVFPDNFPFAPPRAFVRYPVIPPSVETHQFTNGALCLHAEDEWCPKNTGLWVRNRAVAWLHALVEFSNTGNWPAI